MASGGTQAFPIELLSSGTESFYSLVSNGADAGGQSSHEEEESKEVAGDDLAQWARPFPWDRQVERMNSLLFGNDSFKCYQREIINATKSNRDVIGLLPTGGGKSLTFQLTANTEDGATLIIYPLLSLIANQMDALTKQGLYVRDAKDFSEQDLHSILSYNL